MSEPIKFYMDEHIPKAVTEGLRRRGVDVLTAQEAGMLGASDQDHLALAVKEKRVLLTRDADFLRMHATGERNHGIVFVPHNVQVGSILRGLMVLFDVLTAEDMIGHVEFL